jgi:large subunit ribosomal protein L9e
VRSHSEELLEIPEGVKVSIKTRNVVVEGAQQHVEHRMEDWH